MKITVHRGMDQIGGNVIEISTDKTKILLDAGLELNPIFLWISSTAQRRYRFCADYCHTV